MMASTLALRDHVRDYSDLSTKMTMPCLFYDGEAKTPSTTTCKTS